MHSSIRAAVTPNRATSLAEAEEALRPLGLKCLLFASPGYTAAAPKWRLLVPTSKPLPPAKHPQLVARLDNLLGGIRIIGLSELYYFGSVGNNPEHRAVLIDGAYIDERHDLDAAIQANGNGGAGNGVGYSATMTNGSGAAIATPPKPKPVANPLIAMLAEKIWGPSQLVGKEFHFKGSAIVVDPGKGQWFDFERNKGGGIKDLMKLVTTTKQQRSNDDVQIVCAAEVKMRGVDWLWEGHLACGHQEITTGMPDVGKSQIQMNLIACATARRRWPNGAPAIEPVNVIMLTAEDVTDQVVVPRLVAAGADLSRVHILNLIKTDERERRFLLGEDLERLERTMNKIGDVRLVALDPITAYMGRLDSNSPTDVRSQLGPLGLMAERRIFTIFGVA
jgi:AAA domain